MGQPLQLQSGRDIGGRCQFERTIARASLKSHGTGPHHHVSCRWGPVLGNWQAQGPDGGHSLKVLEVGRSDLPSFLSMSLLDCKCPSCTCLAVIVWMHITWLIPQVHSWRGIASHTHLSWRRFRSEFRLLILEQGKIFCDHWDRMNIVCIREEHRF